jgi:hypothetical protein
VHERRHCVVLLASDVERLAAGHEQAESRTGAEQIGNTGRRLHDVLEVVEEEEHRPIAEVVCQLLLGAQNPRRGLEYQPRVAERGQRHPPDAVLVVGGELAGHLNRKASLARPSSAGESQQSDFGSAQKLEDVGELSRAPDERGRRDWQVRASQLSAASITIRDGSSGRRLERGVVAQDALLQPLQGRARLNSELLDEDLPGLLVGVEGVCLAVGAVEGEHLLSAEALQQRVFANEERQLAEHVLVTTLGEIAIDPVHEHGQPQLVELHHFVPSERLESEPGECGTAPERERLLQQP